MKKLLSLFTITLSLLTSPLIAQSGDEGDDHCDQKNIALQFSTVPMLGIFNEAETVIREAEMAANDVIESIALDTSALRNFLEANAPSTWGIDRIVREVNEAIAHAEQNLTAEVQSRAEGFVGGLVNTFLADMNAVTPSVAFRGRAEWKSSNSGPCCSTANWSHFQNSKTGPSAANGQGYIGFNFVIGINVGPTATAEVSLQAKAEASFKITTEGEVIPLETEGCSASLVSFPEWVGSYKTSIDVSTLVNVGASGGIEFSGVLPQVEAELSI